MNKLTTVLIALLPFGISHASQTNVGFIASDNQSEIFIEKCKRWRAALDKQDIDEMWTFVEDKYKGKFKDKMTQKLQKRIDKHQGYLNHAGAYVERSVTLSTQVPNDVAQVIIKWDNDGKGGADIGYVESCVFEQRPGTDQWVLDF